MELSTVKPKQSPVVPLASPWLDMPRHATRISQPRYQPSCGSPPGGNPFSTLTQELTTNTSNSSNLTCLAMPVIFSWMTRMTSLNSSKIYECTWAKAYSRCHSYITPLTTSHALAILLMALKCAWKPWCGGKANSIPNNNTKNNSACSKRQTTTKPESLPTEDPTNRNSVISSTGNIHHMFSQ